jgi:hypothetical protein
MDEREQRAEEQLRPLVHTKVAGGYLPFDQIEEEAADYLVGSEEDLGEEALRAMAKRLVAEAAEAHRRAQATWPSTTDCDRIAAAYATLEKRGILCGEHLGYTQSDGLDLMHDRREREARAGRAPRGYAFFYEQDVEGAVEYGHLLFAFGRFEPDGEPEPDEAIGSEVAAALSAQGLTVKWDGDPGKRVEIAVRWQKRRPDPPTPSARAAGPTGPPPMGPAKPRLSLWRRLFGR